MPNNFLNYNNTPEFNKDFKQLLKRFKTLESDFETMKKYVLETYFIQKIENNAFVPIENFCSDIYTSYKIRKFACKALKNFGNRSGIRIVFVYDLKIKTISFIEIYYKGDKENEDRERLLHFIKNNYNERC